MQLSISYIYAQDEIAAVMELQSTIMGTVAVLTGEPIPPTPALNAHELFSEKTQITVGNSMGGTTTTTIRRDNDNLIFEVDMNVPVEKVKALLSALSDIAFWGRTFPVHAIKEIKELSC